MRQFIDFQGCKLAYRVAGTGEPVVFIQGVGLHGEGWRPQTDVLSNGYRCLTFDNRGMASSQPAAGPITVSQMAADTLAIMDAAKIASAHIVGHSLGGCIAQEIALTAGTRVKSLALLCTSARGADALAPRWRMLWVGTRSRIGTRRMKRRAFLEMIFSPEYLASSDRDALAEDMAALFGHDLGVTPPVVGAQLRALRKFDARRRLAQLAEIPTLVVSAGHDPIFPVRLGRALADGLAGAHFIEIPNASHGATIECAEMVNRLLADHFEAAKCVSPSAMA